MNPATKNGLGAARSVVLSRLLTAFGRALLSLRYRVVVRGLDSLPPSKRRGCLILPNHPALIDPVIVACHLYPAFAPRPLADLDQVKGAFRLTVAGLLGVWTIPDPVVYGRSSVGEIDAVFKEIVERLRAGENVLLYPSGRIMRSALEHLGANSALDRIVAAIPDVTIAVVRTTGLWGSGFSRAYGRYPDFRGNVRRGVVGVLKSFLFFAPRRDVVVEVSEPEIPHDQGRLVVNRALEAVYNRDILPATYIPYSIFEAGGVRTIPEPGETAAARNEENTADAPGWASAAGGRTPVAADVREKVVAMLREMSGVSEINDSASLALDLGLDSLRRVELQLAVESEFGVTVRDPESVSTVADLLRAAAGTLVEKPPEIPQVPDEWFGDDRPEPIVPDGATITEVFLKKAAESPDLPAMADTTGGVRTFREIVLGVLALRPLLAELPGPYLGIMIPASAGAGVIYLAALFAGKTPVFVNWTVGERNIRHSLDLLGVRHIVTAEALLRKLTDQRIGLDAVADRFLTVETLRSRITKPAKLLALLRSRLSWRSLADAKPPEIAVVLFTSGSEALPKAVPLTHANLLANVRAALAVIRLTRRDRLLAFLPPFHSFGLTGNLLPPLVAGLRTVFYPNPTEGGALAAMAGAYRATAALGTPTFLSGLVRVASDAQIKELRIVVTGAEKCPESLYATFRRRRPGIVVLEGYGITECSPVVSLTREGEERPGTIGHFVDGVEGVLREAEGTGRPPEGKAGMLLVRGPNIFPGYLNFDGRSPFEEFEGKVWYRTGDLVRFEPDGTMVFVGRLKRFVKVGGEMVSLPAVEEVLSAAFPATEDEGPVLAVEALGTEEAPEVTLFTTRGSITREIANVALREGGLSPIHSVRNVVRVGRIPLLGSGKTDYRALKASV